MKVRSFEGYSQAVVGTSLRQHLSLGKESLHQGGRGLLGLVRVATEIPHQRLQISADLIDPGLSECFSFETRIEVTTIFFK